jgi:hypothetical protein
LFPPGGDGLFGPKSADAGAMNHARTNPAGAPRHAIFLLAAIAAMSAGCAAVPRGAADDEDPASQKAKDSYVNSTLYAIDGSTETACDDSDIYQLSVAAATSMYEAGPSLDPDLGSRLSFDIMNQVYAQICSDYGNDPTMHIYLTGWSRGAMVAVRLANMLNDDACGQSTSVPVEWVGLIDAVDTDMDPLFSDDGTWPTDLPNNVSRAIHATKQDQCWDPEYGPILATTDITADGCVSFEVDSSFPLDHSQMGFSGDVYNLIEGDAIAWGLAMQGGS